MLRKSKQVKYFNHVLTLLPEDQYASTKVIEDLKAHIYPPTPCAKILHIHLTYSNKSNSVKWMVNLHSARKYLEKRHGITQQL